MEKILSKKELYSKNIIGVKVESQKREYVPSIGSTIIVKQIRRTSYLKICWMCGNPFESNRISAIACNSRCSQNIWHTRKLNLNPPANMMELCKPKNVKEVKDGFGYR